MSGTPESPGKNGSPRGSASGNNLAADLADLIRDLRHAWGDGAEITVAPPDAADPGTSNVGRSQISSTATFRELAGQLGERPIPAGGNSNHEEPGTSEPVSGMSDQERLAELAVISEQIAACTSCQLAQGRNLAVPGILPLNPRVLVIGEGPGAEEDRRGEPFVGRAGEYLDRWLTSIGLQRNRDAAITNVVKCRPPGNRDPAASEILACTPYLRRQIALLQPRSILTVGRFSARFIAGREGSMASFRGEVFRWGAIPVVCTYHPSAVLRDPGLRRPVWEDLQRLDQLNQQ